MTLEDILKKCEFAPNATDRGEFRCLLDGKSTISHNRSVGWYNHPYSGESFIVVSLYHHDKINALQFNRVTYFTCSPPWNRTRQTVLEKYSKDSVIIEDLTDAKNKTNQITFHSDDEKNETIIASEVVNSWCPGGYGLSVTLVNDLKYDEEPLYKQLLNDLQNKIPVPKL